METVITSLSKFDYKWYACSAAMNTAVTSLPATCTAIPGATASTYRAVASDAGKFISVAVSGTSSGTVSTIYTPSMGAVTP
jgi:hypothetical protein